MTTNVIPLATLRPDASLENDLRWFFQCSSGEMGLRSNWEMYAREGMFLTRRRSTFSVDFHAQHLDLRGAHRELPIRRALQEISADERAVLYSVYAELGDVMATWPGLPANARAELYAAYRDLAGLVPFVATGEHKKSRNTDPVVTWLLKIAKNSKKSQASASYRAAVVREAERRLVLAASAFQKAQRVHKPPRRERPRLQVLPGGMEG